MTARSSPPPEPPDSDVVAAAAGDPEAFGLLFERHARAVHSFLARRAGTTTADDLLGEVFVTAFDVRGRYDMSASDARPWLYGIARNLVLARGRGERRRAAAVARLPLDRPADDWPQVDDRLDARAAVRTARDALRTLPDAEREVLELVAWEDLTPTEAALVLGIPAGTARSRLHRARAALRGALPAAPLAQEA
jgi:RNA polymerase sigma-70 factor (ECF subfamily)